MHHHHKNDHHFASRFSQMSSNSFLINVHLHGVYIYIFLQIILCFLVRLFALVFCLCFKYFSLYPLQVFLFSSSVYCKFIHFKTPHVYLKYCLFLLHIFFHCWLVTVMRITWNTSLNCGLKNRFDPENWYGSNWKYIPFNAALNESDVDGGTRFFSILVFDVLCLCPSISQKIEKIRTRLIVLPKLIESGLNNEISCKHDFIRNYHT